MTRVLALGGVSYDTIIYLDNFPRPQPGTVFPGAFHATVGSNGTGDALSAFNFGHANGCRTACRLRLGAALVSGFCLNSRELAFASPSAAPVEQEHERAYGR